MPEQDEADIQSPPSDQLPDSDDQSDAVPPVADAEQPVRTEPEADAAQPVPAEVEGDATPVLLIPAHVGDTDAAADDAPHDAAPVEPPAREPRRFSRAERETLDRQRRRFAACTRCGYFIADCLNYLGEETVQSAMLAARDSWLRLEGDSTFHRLAMNAYGPNLDVAFDAFDGVCPECLRRYVLTNSPNGPTRLKIHV